MGVREALSAVVGGAQVATGTLTILLIYSLYHNYFDAQTIFQGALGAPIERLMPLLLLILFTFGFLSIFSGLFLIQEYMESRR